MDELLKVSGLNVEFPMPAGISRIINNFHLSFRKNSFLGLVGESGSGKTVFAYSLLGITKQPGVISGGEILYKGKDVLKMSEEQLIRNYRSKEAGLIASNARAHLNPLLPVGRQISTVYAVHTGKSKKESDERTLEMLELVKINDPKRRFAAYPHELSGGMAQRIMIAMALCNTPQLLIADDCTNGLDVTVAAQIMDLFLQIIQTQHSSGILITHDLGIVAQCCTDIAIIYCGQIIETASVADFFFGCRHPYSHVLLNSLPQNAHKRVLKRSGAKIDSFNLPAGCYYYDRCPVRRRECAIKEPELTRISASHSVKCNFPNG